MDTKSKYRTVKCDRQSNIQSIDLIHKMKSIQIYEYLTWKLNVFVSQTKLKVKVASCATKRFAVAC